MPPPSPFNLVEFDAYIANNRPANMRREQIREELAYWSTWRDGRGRFDERPRPRRALRWGGTVLGAIGAIVTIAGPIGMISARIGNWMTMVGFLAYLASLGVRSNANLDTEREVTARALVAARVSELAKRYRALKG